MTRDEVVALLGEPSGRFLVPADGSSDAVRVERWSWGDSLSTVATQQLFRDQPDPRVWSVLFDADGRVVDVWVPQPEASARLRRLETTR